MQSEKPGYFHCQFKSRVIFVILDGYDRLSGHSQLPGKIFLAEPGLFS